MINIKVNVNVYDRKCNGETKKGRAARCCLGSARSSGGEGGTRQSRAGGCANDVKPCRKDRFGLAGEAEMSDGPASRSLQACKSVKGKNTHGHNHTDPLFLPHEGAQHSIHPGLIAWAALLEPIDDVRVEPEG